MTQQEEFKVLSPEVTITLSTGESIVLKPFTFGQLPKALAKANGIGALIQQAAQSGDLKSEVLGVMGEGGEDLIELVSMGVGKDREWFNTLGADDGVYLTTEFLAVNFDFFTKRVLPQFEKGMSKFKSSRTSLSSSSEQASA